MHVYIIYIYIHTHMHIHRHAHINNEDVLTGLLGLGQIHIQILTLN